MFTLSIVTPQKKILADQEIDEVFVPAFRGELNVLPGHAPLVTTLTPGVLRYRTAGSEEVKAVSISWGYCEVTQQAVSVMAETAETPEEIDRERVHIELKESLTQLAAPDVDVELLDKYRRKLEQAQARMDLLDFFDGKGSPAPRSDKTH